MKKSHKREVFMARVIFAIFIVVVAAVLALAIMLISTHLKNRGKDDADGKNPQDISMNQPTEQEPEDDWIQSTEPVTPEESEQTVDPAVPEESEQFRWTTTKVNFRRTPSTTEDNLIEEVGANVQVEFVSETDGWTKVKYNDYEGYISSDYLTNVNPNGGAADPAEGTDQTTENTVNHKNAKSVVVVIDPGHQASGDSSTEANGPGSTVMKAKVTGGATGVATGVPEYQLNLDVSLLLRKELKRRGYQVEMTRTTNDVNISNKERAEFASKVDGDIAVRIHANFVDTESVRGAETISPSSDNPYVASLAASSLKMSEQILREYCKETGIENRGCSLDDSMTGINWSSIPVTIVELGFMSNTEEDKKMQQQSVQKKMAEGIANGIDAYFGF